MDDLQTRETMLQSLEGKPMTHTPTQAEIDALKPFQNIIENNVVGGIDDDTGLALVNVDALAMDLVEAAKSRRLAVTDGANAEQDPTPEQEAAFQATKAARVAAPPPEMEPDSPEDIAEHFIQAAIDSAPEPLRRLGEWLADHLDDDQWKTADRLITGAAVALARAAPPATDGAEARVGAVKPLEWGEETADVPFGRYQVIDTDTGFRFRLHTYRYGVTGDDLFGTVLEAKAAAQADYEARVRSALIEAPPAPSQELSAAEMREAAAMAMEKRARFYADRRHADDEEAIADEIRRDGAMAAASAIRSLPTTKESS